MKPLVAIGGRIGAPGKVSRNPVAFAGRPYLDAVMRAGAEPVVLAPQDLDHRSAMALLRRFDGLVLMGGSDVDPELFGERPHPKTYGVNRENDEIEMALARAAIELELPTLAICRGMQVANVALGGTLHQHLVDAGIDGLIEHGPPGFPAPPDGVLHEIQTEPGTRLAKALERELFVGASYHHQAVAEPADGFRVTALAADGVIEAMEHEQGWFVGVQWHPEDTAPTDAVQQRLYDVFIEQAGGG
jgi:putative glutamine amidotransferase